VRAAYLHVCIRVDVHVCVCVCGRVRACACGRVLVGVCLWACACGRVLLDEPANEYIPIVGEAGPHHRW